MNTDASMPPASPSYPATGDSLPVPVVVEPGDPVALVNQSQSLIVADGGNPFPSFGVPVGLFTRDLEGVPFVFTSDAVLRTQPPRKLDDGRTIPAQEVVQVWVRTFDNDWTPSHSQLATLGGRYLVNQLRSATRDNLIGGGLFTVARNPRFVAINGTHPYMLKRYEYGVDALPADDSPFGTEPAPLDTKHWHKTIEEYQAATQVHGQNVAARIAEIQTAGVVPPSYWTDEPAPASRVPETMSRTQFLAELAKLNIPVRAAMNRLGVRTLVGLNLETALATLQAQNETPTEADHG